MAKLQHTDRTTGLCFRFTQNMCEDPIVHIDMYGNSTAVLQSRAQLDEMVRHLDRVKRLLKTNRKRLPKRA